MQNRMLFLLFCTSGLILCSQNVENSTFHRKNGQVYSPYGGYILNTGDGYFSEDLNVLQRHKDEVRVAILRIELENENIRIQKLEERLRLQTENCGRTIYLCKKKLLKRRPRCWSTPDNL